MLEKQREIMGETLGFYRDARTADQAELTVSPRNHPILPLLLKDGWYNEMGEWVDKSSWSEDVEYHLNTAKDVFEDYIGAPVPVGLWPSEQSVSEELVPYIHDAGYQWFVSDEGVLEKSGYDVHDNTVLAKPYRVEKDGKSVDCIFRDRVISDRIAMQYDKKPTAQDAANDFLSYVGDLKSDLQSKGKDPSESLLTIALDGENWMFMGEFGQKDNGRPFLDTFYRTLENTNWIRTVTPAEYLAEHPPEGDEVTIDILAEHCPDGMGSWIDGDQDGVVDTATWHGEKDESLAWQWLVRARRMVESYGPPNSTDPAVQKAWEAIYTCEASDWFWWYGLDQNSGYDELWDWLYKLDLTNVYLALGEAIPPELQNVWVAPASADPAASAVLEPIIDGLDIPGEWEGGAVYTDPVETGSSADISKVIVGYDPVNLYAQIHMSGGEAALDDFVGDENADLSIFVSSPNPRPNQNVYGANQVTKYGGQILNFPGKYRVKIDLMDVLSSGETNIALFKADGEGHWLYQLDKTQQSAAIGEVIEVAIPLDAIDMGTVTTMRLKVVTANTSAKRDIDIGPDLPISLFVPDIAPMIKLMEMEDPVGDETGADTDGDGEGDYTYPSASDFEPRSGLFDLTTVELHATMYHAVFRFHMGEITNIWNMRNGFSHQIIQIYVDKDRLNDTSDPNYPLGKLDMLGGANAQVHPDFAWEVAISITGDMAFLKNEDNIKITAGIEAKGDKNTNVIELRVSKKELGSAVADYGYVIVVGSQDGYGIGGYRDLEPESKTWIAGGGAAANPDDGLQYDPAFFDALLPAELDQPTILGGFDVDAKTYAQIPGINVPEAEQQIIGTTVKGITATSAILTWETTADSTSQVEFGTTEALGNATTEDTTLKKQHSVILTGLEPSTTYYYRSVSREMEGGSVVSEVHSETVFFNTTAEMDERPPMILIPKTEVTENSAIISWSTDEEALVEVAYGTARGSLDSSTGMSTDYVKSHRVSIGDLDPATVYYYQITVEDSLGNSNTSEVKYFITNEEGGIEVRDRDGDGYPDPLDAFPDDARYHADSDGDGMPDAWEAQYGLDVNADDSGEDPDGDGATNLAEFEAGTDPSDAGSTGGSDVAVYQNTTSITLTPGQYAFVPLGERTVGELVEFTPTIRTGALDILLIPDAERANYRLLNRSTDDTFGYFAAVLDIDGSGTSYRVDIPADGTYWLVVDNTLTPVGGAMVSRAEMELRVTVYANPSQPAGTGSTLIQGGLPRDLFTVELAIDAGDHLYYDMTDMLYEKGWQVRVELNHLSGPAIDILLLDDTNYQQYRSNAEPDYQYYTDASALEVKTTTHIFDIPTTGKYWLVFDNTDSPTDGASATGGARVNITLYLDTNPSEPQATSDEVVVGKNPGAGESGDMMLWMIIIIVMVVVLVVLVVVFLFMRSKKGVEGVDGLEGAAIPPARPKLPEDEGVHPGDDSGLYSPGAARAGPGETEEIATPAPEDAGEDAAVSVPGMEPSEYGSATEPEDEVSEPDAGSLDHSIVSFDDNEDDDEEYE